MNAGWQRLEAGVYVHLASGARVYRLDDRRSRRTGKTLNYAPQWGARLPWWQTGDPVATTLRATVAWVERQLAARAAEDAR